MWACGPRNMVKIGRFNIHQEVIDLILSVEGSDNDSYANKKQGGEGSRVKISKKHRYSNLSRKSQKRQISNLSRKKKKSRKRQWTS